jgi:hypothetical protein
MTIVHVHVPGFEKLQGVQSSQLQNILGIANVILFVLPLEISHFLVLHYFYSSCSE